MKYLLFFSIFHSIVWQYNKISAINSLKSAAETAYKKGDFYIAQRNYYHLVTTYKVNDDKVILNLANSCFNNGFLKQASVFYNLLKEKSGHEIHSIALTQLGVIASAEGKFNRSLDCFKKALTLNSKNEDARYNYELLRKYIIAHSKKQPSQNSNKKGRKGPDGKDGGTSIRKSAGASDPQSDSDRNSDSRNESNNAEKLTLRKFEEIKLNLDKAKEIMDLMDRQEIQYIQQLKKIGAHNSEQKFRNY